MDNILTFDIEEYFQVGNFAKSIHRDSWEKMESRLSLGLDIILSILDEYATKATFFVLGWVAERNRGAIKKIHEKGHEIASHGYAHQLIYTQKPKEFRLDLKKSKGILEEIIKEPVLGYRAPTYSVTKKSIWALDILAEEGFVYDSSLFPIHHDKGGLPEAQQYPYRIVKKQGYLWEFPISTIDILGQNVPFSGGGYFRFMPYSFIKWSIKKINSDGNPAVTYFHPWEFDPWQPRIESSCMNRFRHYFNIAKNETKLRTLLNDFRFQPIRDFLISKEGSE